MFKQKIIILKDEWKEISKRCLITQETFDEEIFNLLRVDENKYNLLKFEGEFKLHDFNFKKTYIIFPTSLTLTEVYKIHSFSREGLIISLSETLIPGDRETKNIYIKSYCTKKYIQYLYNKYN